MAHNEYFRLNILCNGLNFRVIQLTTNDTSAATQLTSTPSVNLVLRVLCVLLDELLREAIVNSGVSPLCCDEKAFPSLYELLIEILHEVITNADSSPPCREEMTIPKCNGSFFQFPSIVPIQHDIIRIGDIITNRRYIFICSYSSRTL